MSHTTGHWSIHAPAGSDTYLVAAGSQIVFAINKGTIPTREDARLIAAAPEMLDALYAALPYVEEGEEFNHPDKRVLSKTIRALIAKATGEAA